MPAATTHIQASIDVYKTLSDIEKNKIKNLPMFYLGSQGPDLFFFHNFSTKTLVNKAGNRLHVENIYKCIELMYEYTNDEDILSYFYGYLCHYSFDSCIHPLVYNRAKHLSIKKESEMVNHFRIEAYYDVYVLNKKGKTLKDFDSHILMKISKENKKKLARMYTRIFKEVLNLDIPEKEIYKTCKQIILILSILKPSSILKYKLISKIEDLLKMEHSISSLMLYNTFEDEDYILNTNKETFDNIFINNISYNKSFDELYNQAITKAKTLINNPLNKDMYKLDFNGNPIE